MFAQEASEAFLEPAAFVELWKYMFAKVVMLHQDLAWKQVNCCLATWLVAYLLWSKFEALKLDNTEVADVAVIEYS